MRFKCPRCARRHAFPAARMNAAGRVPCRCGVTLVLNPPRGASPLPSADAVAADIVALGYTIDVERTTGTFEGARQALRGALGLDDGGGGVPDPTRAGRPALLWPALGMAWDPRLALPGALALLLALSSRWVPVPGPLGPLVGRGLVAIGGAVAAAAATIWAAAAAHDAIVERTALTLSAALRAVARRPALLVAAMRDAGLRAAGATLALALAGVLAALGARAADGAIWRWSAPAQIALVVVAGALAFALVLRLLGYAALTPRARGLLTVQVDLEMRRLGAERATVPARGLAPALAASLVFALALAAGVRLILATWDAVAAPFGGLDPVTRAVGRDLVGAAAAGVLCSYLGLTGLLGGYALGTAAARDPVRAPDIITGTQSSMNAVMAGAEEEQEEEEEEEEEEELALEKKAE